MSQNVALPFPRIATEQAAASLEEDLRRIGCPVYSVAIVAAYQREEVRKTVESSGKLKHLRPLAYCLHYARTYILAIGVCAGLGSTAVSYVGWWGVTLPVVSIPAICVFGALFLTSSFNVLGNAGAHWRTRRVRGRFGCGLAEVPTYARNACIQAEQVPGVHVEIDSILDDPIMYAVRQNGRKKERIPVSYWNAWGLEPQLRAAGYPSPI